MQIGDTTLPVGNIFNSIIVRPEIEVAMFLGMNLGIVAWYFGFHKKDNIYMEYFMWKK